MQSAVDEGIGSNDSVSDRLQALLDSGTRLADHAAGGNWDRVQELQSAHHDQIVEFFATVNTSHLTAQNLSDLARVRACTDQVLSLAKETTQQFGDAVKRLQTGRTAARSYGDYSQLK